MTRITTHMQHFSHFYILGVWIIDLPYLHFHVKNLVGCVRPMGSYVLNDDMDNVSNVPHDVHDLQGGTCYSNSKECHAMWTVRNNMLQTNIDVLCDLSRKTIYTTWLISSHYATNHWVIYLVDLIRVVNQSIKEF